MASSYPGCTVPWLCCASLRVVGFALHKHVDSCLQVASCRAGQTSLGLLYVKTCGTPALLFCCHSSVILPEFFGPSIRMTPLLEKSFSRGPVELLQAIKEEAWSSLVA